MGNVDNDGAKTNLFDPPLVAQFIRVIPLVCRKACTLRMELVGCELNGKTPAGATGLGVAASVPTLRLHVSDANANSDPRPRPAHLAAFGHLDRLPVFVPQGVPSRWA